MRDEYRLPDRTSTHDAEEYVRVWREYADPISQVFGWELYGFDPGISFVIKGSVHSFTSNAMFDLHRIALEVLKNRGTDG